MESRLRSDIEVLHVDEKLWMQLENVMQNELAGIAMISESGKIISYNDRFRKLISENVRDREKWSILSITDNFKERLELKCFLDQAVPGSRQSFTVTSAGKSLQIELCCRETQILEKNFFCVAIEVINASGLIKSVRELKLRSKAQESTLFEMCFHCDSTGRLIHFNKAFAQSLRYSNFLEIRNKDAQDFIENNFHEIIDEVRNTGRIRDVQLWIRRKDRSLMHGLANVTSYKLNKGQTIYSWAVLDLTQHTEYEEYSRRMNDKLNKVNFQLEKFLYSASHDLRAPLTSILGLVNLIRMNPHESENEFIDQIEQCVKKLDSVIRNLGFLTRINYASSKSDHIHLSSLCRNLFDRYRTHQFFQRTMFRIDADEKSVFFSDEEKVGIILDQLIKNCLSFSDPAKPQSLILVRINVTDDRAVVDIVDNGIGIAEIHRSSVFNLFYRGSAASQGSGLGLFIVKEGVESLKGTVSLESENELGTRIRLEIPNGTDTKKARLATQDAA